MCEGILFLHKIIFAVFMFHQFYLTYDYNFSEYQAVISSIVQ